MNVINGLYQSGRDYQYYEEAPGLQYMIATIPRSGSTYLAMELWRTGLLGAPMEYANPPYIELMKRRLQADLDITSYWREIKRLRTSPNGVFGFKMFIANYLHCKEMHPELLREISPDKVIFLTRSNVVEQAVSLSKAVQSKAWFHGVATANNAEYNFEHIDACVEVINEQIRCWKEIFNLTETEFLQVSYEELLSDSIGSVKRICHYLGVEFNPLSALSLPTIQVQRNSESEEWALRYEEESKHGDCSAVGADGATILFHPDLSHLPR